MIARRHVLRSIRRLYEWARNDPVDAELRGWSWDRPPLKPRAYLGLGVSEVASKYCPTRRDVWLRRKIGARAEATEPLLAGRLIHDAVSLALKEVARALANNIPPATAYLMLQNKWRILSPDPEHAKTVEEAYKATLLINLGEAQYEQVINGSSQTPTMTEYKIDGTPIGLSQNLSVDILLENIIIDMKCAQPRDFHKLTLAGYALALEAHSETPHDYGILVYISNNNGLKTAIRPVYISNDLRRWFIEERDEIIDMLLEDREPPRDVKCPEACPLTAVCA
ncbi:MAG: type I-A CRISPR-associated protein Cas4/Csa1 [Sulfolobales archaeon]